jgi:glutathione peroxidase
MTTIRQKALRLIYPLLMKAMEWVGKNRNLLYNKEKKHFQTPIHNLSVMLNNGTEIPLHKWQGKKILFVNTASDCGYTAQYGELQQLQSQFPETLQVIGFPANDFKEQERGSDSAIAQFCSINYGVSFPLAKRSSVVKGPQQHPVFQWLTQKEKNGWNEKAPSWNFSKYLVDEQGMLTHYFDPAVTPLGNDIINAIRI